MMLFHFVFGEAKFKFFFLSLFPSFSNSQTTSRISYLDTVRIKQQIAPFHPCTAGELLHGGSGFLRDPHNLSYVL